MNSKIIAVDFDGTLCENKWPEIGEANEDKLKEDLWEYGGVKLVEGEGETA